MRVDEEVLAVLSQCRCDGNTLYLPPDQLERKLYEKTNKVLEAIGGKWNRKAKGHVFGSDPVARLDDVMVSGVVDLPADFGFFPTPAPLARRVADCLRVEAGERVLEPSAGRGAIARELARTGAEVVCVELQREHARYLREDLPYAAVHEADFLSWRDDGNGFDAVGANPPFARQQDIAHVTHAFSMLRPRGRLVAIMSAGVTFRQDRKSVAFRQLVESNGGDIQRLPEESFKASGTSVSTVLVSISKAS